MDDISRMEIGLARGGEFSGILKNLLQPDEIGALRVRCSGLIQHPFLPIYDPARRMVPYPPL
jgi:hypothetical protein